MTNRRVESLIAWADEIDNRLGPISGMKADSLAQMLRIVAAEISMYGAVIDAATDLIGKIRAEGSHDNYGVLAQELEALNAQRAGRDGER